jgi:hypothetical protein
LPEIPLPDILRTEQKAPVKYPLCYLSLFGIIRNRKKITNMKIITSFPNHWLIGPPGSEISRCRFSAEAERLVTVFVVPAYVAVNQY